MLAPGLILNGVTDGRLGVMRIIMAPRLESREMLGAEKMFFLPRLMVCESQGKMKK